MLAHLKIVDAMSDHQDGNGDISFNEFVWLMTRWVKSFIAWLGWSLKCPLLLGMIKMASLLLWNPFRQQLLIDLASGLFPFWNYFNPWQATIPPGSSRTLTSRETSGRPSGFLTRREMGSSAPRILWRYVCSSQLAKASALMVLICCFTFGRDRWCRP